ncbi:helicase-exonuclease AddAB subunit AddB [Ureibacillus manganicus]|uniref:ATP-dependent helicase/deoxyribonuclease subunit B n=1 Tax=Ureibacillus manganicus DSM 26584 TaxID=1384049 RepID=A0A0A3ICN1_9BACL|nr:helicase-exonuclease AddAB subunit AddB [Ureibacillus manganicus]KGR80578.1 ATP-dependent helicase [Ureibacillus manganicus DSM 26584]
MSLRVISGRAGAGKTSTIHKEIVKELKKDPLGAPIYIIVPDQMSFSTEYDLTNKYEISGIMRAQVMTFKRLAWYILQETGGIARDRIDKIGYQMLIRRLLMENKDKFSLFRQAADKRGFTNEVVQLIKEFSQFNIQSNTLNEIIAQLEEKQAPHTLLSKTKDLQIILQELEQELGDTYVDGEAYYPVLLEQLKNSQKVKEAHIYIDGFTQFTVREFEIIKQLLLFAERVTVVLPLEDEHDKDDDQALFFRGAVMYDKLMEEAKNLQVDIEPREHFFGSYRYNNLDLKHIEANFHEPIWNSRKAQGFVRIFEGANRRAEVHAIAREICRLVKEENVRYKDIGIMYRQADVYDPLILTTFSQYDIPVFTNEKKTMLHHPLIEFSRSILEVVTSKWQYEPVFRSVKTDLFFPLKSDVNEMREKADRFENFVIAQGIYGYRWFEKSRWLYKKYRGLEFLTNRQTDEELSIQKIIDEIRDMIRGPLEQLQNKLANAETGREIAICLYQFIEELQIYEKLQALKDSELGQHQLNEASEHDQAWNKWVNVLDQFVIMFGDQKMTVEEAAKILDEGYDTLEFSNIPPAVDEVKVGTVEYSRYDNMKVVFVIGVNDGVYPMRMDYEGLITDTERGWFAAVDTELSPTSKHRLLQEAFLIYRAFSSPTDRLYVTFASSDEESKSLLPSLYVNRLHKLFEVDGQKTLPHQRILIDPIEELEQDNVLSYIRHPRTSVAYLMMQLRQAQYTHELSPEWVALKRFYEQDAKWKIMLEAVMRPLEKKNEAENLTQDITDELYGTDLNSSVSRIEKFYSCPFAHFSTYGLGLEERVEYKLETFAMGDLFHEALKWISMETNKHKIHWNKLSREQCTLLARQAVEHIVPVFSHQILLSSARYRYIQHKLMRIVEKTMIALSHQAKSSGFKPIAIEASFGPGKEMLPPLEIDLDGGRKMRLRGRIDRIDSAEINEKSYLRVVDYKSSSRDLDLNEVYHGLSLQLLTYLNVAVDNASHWIEGIAQPAGVLYVHVHNPLLKLEEELDEGKLEIERLRQYRMKGLLSEDPTALVLMDEELEVSGKSIIVPVQFKNDGSVYQRNSRVVQPLDMQNLQQFVRKKHQEAGNGILSGETSIRPYKLKSKTACDFCSFKSVCQFDVSDNMQKYHKLQTEKSDVVVTKISEELNNDARDSN